jgi:glutaredoxin
MKHIILLLSCLAAMPLYVQADELYRWVDDNGKVHYGDTRPADATDVERKNLSSDVSQNTDLPYETRLAQQNFPVTLYAGENCGELCDRARSLLNKRGVPFSDKLLKTKSEIEAFQKLSGSNNSPTLLIGKTYLSGFSESAWNSELDVTGYPKTASYRQRIAPPVPPATPPATETPTAPTEPVAQ